MDQELVDKKIELRKKILPMQWDMDHKQLNTAKKVKLDAYKKELKELEEKKTDA